MKYKNKQYNWVNEKVVDGVLYQCFRCDTDPRKDIMVIDGKISTPKSLKNEWKALGLKKESKKNG